MIVLQTRDGFLFRYMMNYVINFTSNPVSVFFFFYKIEGNIAGVIDSGKQSTTINTESLDYRAMGWRKGRWVEGRMYSLIK